jgi:hypothetical protein
MDKYLFRCSSLSFSRGKKNKLAQHTDNTLAQERLTICLRGLRFTLQSDFFLETAHLQKKIKKKFMTEKLRSERLR